MADDVDRAFGAGRRDDSAARVTNHAVYCPHKMELGRHQGESYTREALDNLNAMLVSR
jgi:hypothetical protein